MILTTILRHSTDIVKIVPDFGWQIYENKFLKEFEENDLAFSVHIVLYYKSRLMHLAWMAAC